MARARHALEFFPRFLTHVEGDRAGQALELSHWQQAIIANLYGWIRPDGARRYREALIYLPRKNGKTTLAAGIALYTLFCDGEAGQQNFAAASDRDQAALLYRIAAGMVRQNPQLEKRCKIYEAVQQRSIVLQRSSSFLRVLSADAETKHGLNPHLVLIDELHVQKNRNLYDVLRTGQASRSEPLLIAITTADIDRPSICNEMHEHAKRVADGSIADCAFLPVLYEAEREDDWTLPATWAKANPGLNESITIEYLARECARAQTSPTYENAFRRLHLNQKTEQELRYIPLAAWDACTPPEAASPTAEDVLVRLDGRRVFAGLDLASTTDLCAAVLIARDEAGVLQIVPRFWCPAEAAEAREQRDRVPYLAWAKQGLISMTPGNVADYERIRADLRALDERFNFVKCGVDPWNSRQLSQQLLGDGVQMVEVRQGYYTLNEPTKELLRLVLSNALRHDHNPIMRWMVGNLAVESDAAGNVKPTKARSRDRIDGISALVTALAVSDLKPQSSGPHVAFID